MYTSELEIINSALIKVGAERITSLTADCKSAKICREIYPRVRDKVISSHPWNFAINRVELGLVSGTPEYGFDCMHQIPVDCLRVLEVYDAGDKWRREGDKILSNSTTAKMRYIKKETDVTKYTAYFGELLSASLASEIAYALTQSTTLRDTLKAEEKDSLRNARSYNAQERSADSLNDDVTDWVAARY